MSKSKEKIIERKTRKSFAERLAQKFEESGIGTINVGVLSDKSASWVSIQKGDYSINFTLDAKGEKIDRIGLYKDVWQVVDNKQLFSMSKDEAK